jgi:dTDP-4-amino-4,6-dideoxygalactose transaminase
MPLLYIGAKLVFADVKPGNLTIDPRDVERKITKKTKAIIAVTLGGIPIDKRIFQIAKKKKIPVITDSCQSPGYNQGDYITYSFQAIKHMTTCDGGMLVLKNKEEYKRAKLLRWFGIDREQKAKKKWQAWERRAMTFDILEPGFKFQPTNLDAMLGLVALEDWDKIIRERNEFVKIYKKELKGVKGIDLFEDKGSSNWLFGILTDRRDELAKGLEKVGIGTNLVHLRNDIFKVFGGKRQNLPGMASVEFRYLYLPLHNRLTKKDIFVICQTIKTIKSAKR